MRWKIIVLTLCLLPVIGYAAADADIWRTINQGAAGYSAVKGKESAVLIQTSGQDWRSLRNSLIKTGGAGLLLITLLSLLGFYKLRGQVKLVQPRTGELIPRWSVWERLIHAYTAVLFLLLMLTGLSLLFGRTLLLPLVGQTAFSQYANFAKLCHNYLGPLFILGLIVMILIWFKDNLPNKIDVQWLKQRGGLVGDQHPSAERMNAGEKIWFWLLLLAGSLVSLTGLVLDLNNLGFSREIMQYSHIIHSLTALILMVGALGHIYIGTIGTEGALEGMKTGQVDASWAKQHHDLWYRQVQDKKH